jgi:excinuclease UvrABC ATPase subunit
MTNTPPDRPRIRSVVVVGVCGSGKSELVRRLCAAGFAARVVAQEHSIIRELWRHQGVPDALIYLGASPATVANRGRGIVSPSMLAIQEARLADARAAATVAVATDLLTASEVAELVIDRLKTGA